MWARPSRSCAYWESETSTHRGLPLATDPPWCACMPACTHATTAAPGAVIPSCERSKLSILATSYYFLL